MPPYADVSAAIRAALLQRDPRAKVMATRNVARDWRLGRLPLGFSATMPDEPGRPPRPELLSPGQMPKRGKAGSERGRIALWHALGHIEFVAIDLALDMAGRFGTALPPESAEEFVSDFLAVAADEAIHFALIDRHLRRLGSFYGALPAHAGLWSAARETSHDVLARLAVVPMVLEARGLDVTPGTLARVRGAGDQRGAAILQRILDDEIRHVRFGAKHFTVLVERTGEDPAELWKSLVARHFRGMLKPPFNDSARLAAGLSRDFYAGVVCEKTHGITHARETAGGSDHLQTLRT
ncbi:ferritin-like domain-containing protein [Novosphingobium colocasiae]|uniref:ferritin-like domain-containing protein n=1 Tax=Novosphingobium colocasiae TaxID=1256513 RepID=UPI0035B30B93